ncbi:hypothetical protein CRENBAI_017047 [Crenichthys baileyi]|uniref:Uncharacterized protein n=1 Tax=Crenichthys baileyi TaxID=28760 RepID=A0AAV9R8J2_9TELE
MEYRRAQREPSTSSPAKDTRQKTSSEQNRTIQEDRLLGNTDQSELPVEKGNEDGASGIPVPTENTQDNMDWYGTAKPAHPHQPAQVSEGEEDDSQVRRSTRTRKPPQMFTYHFLGQPSFQPIYQPPPAVSAVEAFLSPAVPIWEMVSNPVCATRGQRSGQAVGPPAEDCSECASQALVCVRSTPKPHRDKDMAE